VRSMRRQRVSEQVEDLISRFLKRDRGALARLISLVEDRVPEATAVLEELFPKTGKALTVGVTGPPGVGKSTLVGCMASEISKRGSMVGVIAVDPTSNFSGGAILGDRVRMGEVSATDGVFVRSMATRGSVGGLSAATQDAASLMDAYGFEWIFLETVGVGQLEMDVADSADITLVVVMPASGDSVQAMKAGLMEIGDIFVVNKADRQGAEYMVDDLSMMFEITVKDEKDRPPVVKTVATKNEGIGYLLGIIEQTADAKRADGTMAARRRARIRNRIASIVEGEMLKDFWKRKDLGSRVEHVADEVFQRRTTPYAAARRILEDVG
jgi:LAO/AO transport system kinase